MVSNIRTAASRVRQGEISCEAASQEIEIALRKGLQIPKFEEQIEDVKAMIAEVAAMRYRESVDSEHPHVKDRVAAMRKMDADLAKMLKLVEDDKKECEDDIKRALEALEPLLDGLRDSLGVVSR
jgi:hypothetical protein